MTCLRIAALYFAFIFGFAVEAQAALRQPVPIGAHAMIWDQPYNARKALFREASRLGVSHVRIAHYVDGPLEPLGENIDLARRYGLQVLVTLTSRSSDWDAFPGQTGTVANVAGWAVTEWEILNEPDGGIFFKGTAEEYVVLLNATYQAIHDADPVSRVLIGGLVHRDPAWTEGHFDTANGHARPSRAARAGWIINAWREFFAAPFQVTEFGYPADPESQSDPDYLGESGQARFYRRTLPTMIRGSERVYVTLRDLGGMAQRQFHHEGLLARSDIDNGQGSAMRRRPAFDAVSKEITERFPRIGRTHYRFERHGQQVTWQLRGDEGCLYERRVSMQRRTADGWQTRSQRLSDTAGRVAFNNVGRNFRLVARRDGVCQREVHR